MENVAWALVHWLGPRDPDVAPEVVERVRMLHYLAPLNFGRSFNDIWISARDGDEESLFALVQMDKSALYADEIRDIVVRKQYEGDWRFFEKLGKAIARPPLTGAARWHKAVLVVAYFWDDHFSRPEWPVPKIFRLLKDEGVLARQDKLTAFRFRLNRAGLKKPLHNRKPGN